MQTFLYPCIPQCCGEGGALWALLGDTQACEPVAHDEATPAFLPTPLSLWNPSTLRQGLCDILPLLTLDLDHDSKWRGEVGIFPTEDTMTTQGLIEHGKFKDLEDVQYDQLGSVRKEWPKTMSN